LNLIPKAAQAVEGSGRACWPMVLLWIPAAS